MMLILVYKFFKHGGDLHLPFGNRNPAGSYELHDPVRTQLLVQVFDLFPSARFGDHKEIAGYGNDLGMAFLDDILDLPFIEQQVGSDLKQSRFQEYGFIIVMVIGLDHIDLFFDLTHDISYPFFGGTHHDDEPHHMIDLRS